MSEAECVDDELVKVLEVEGAVIAVRCDVQVDVVHGETVVVERQGMEQENISLG